MAQNGCLAGQAGSWYDISLISVSFLVAFSAYNTIYSLATSFLPGNLGSVSLGILYATVAIGVWLSPGIADRIGLKWSIVVGLATYVVFEASLIKINYWVVVAASVVIGSGSGVLWVAVGQKIADAARGTISLGVANGVFWSVFQVNGVLGPLLTYFVLPHLKASSSLFVMFTAFGAAGTLLVAFLRPDSDDAKSEAGPGAGTSTPQEEASASAPLLAGTGTGNGTSIGTRDGDGDAMVPAGNGSTAPSGAGPSSTALSRDGSDGFWLIVWRGIARATSTAVSDWRVRLLAPLFFLTGWELAFWSGEFPQVISKHDVPLTATVVGVGEVLGGLVFGWLSDRIGRLAVVGLASGLYCTGLVLVMVARAEVEFDSESGEVTRTAHSLGPVLGETALGLFAAALCFGLGDSGLYTQCLAVIGDVFPKEDGGIGGEQRVTSGEGGKTAGSTSEGPEGIEGGAVSVDVFAVFYFLNNVGSAVGFLLQVPAPLLRNGGTRGTPMQVWMLAGVFAASLAGFGALVYGQRQGTPGGGQGTPGGGQASSRQGGESGKGGGGGTRYVPSDVAVNSQEGAARDGGTAR